MAGVAESKPLVMKNKVLGKLKLGTKFMLVVGLVVAVAISSLFVWTYKEKEKHIIHEVEKQAEITFEQIVLTRRWNADYGGVYVEKREGVESNPYLYEVGVNPDITDIEGRNYTLKNPALMTRELSSYAVTGDVFRFHITSLKLVNPNNAPNDFERKALEEFEMGKKSVSQIGVEDDAPIFQYMAPLYVEEACLKCHGHQGYKVGDVRGGISVILPMEEAYLAIYETKKNLFFSALAIIAVLEVTLFYLTRIFVTKPIKKLTKGAEEIGGGNLDYGLDIKSDDEFGVLASSFNTMAKKLKASYMNLKMSEASLAGAHDELETRVRKRTTELSETNESLQEQITERKKAEVKLTELSQKNELILDAAGEGIYGLDLEGITTFVNPAAAKMIGWEVEDIIGKSQHDLLHHTHPDGTPYKREECPIYAAFTDGKVHHVDSEVFWRKDGSSFPVEYISTPVRDEAGKLTGAVVTFRDITERKKAEEVRERLHNELADKNRDLQQLLYVASHDLRTPLVNAQGFSGELFHSCERLVTLLETIDNVPAEVQGELDSILKGEIPSSLNYITSSTTKMNDLLNGLLELSRIDKSEVDYKPLDMNKLIGEVVKSFEYVVKEEGIEINSEDLPSCIGNESQITRVFTNLVDNAIKYQDNKRELEIRITGKTKGGQATYGVEDNGIGIRKEQQEKIFEIFHRLNPEEIPGEGIGLTIIKKIVERHQGKIRVKSNPGKGSKFYITLPHGK